MSEIILYILLSLAMPAAEPPHGCEPGRPTLDGVIGRVDELYPTSVVETQSSGDFQWLYVFVEGRPFATVHIFEKGCWMAGGRMSAEVAAETVMGMSLAELFQIGDEI